MDSTPPGAWYRWVPSADPTQLVLLLLPPPRPGAARLRGASPCGSSSPSAGPGRGCTAACGGAAHARICRPSCTRDAHLSNGSICALDDATGLPEDTRPVPRASQQHDQGWSSTRATLPMPATASVSVERLERAHRLLGVHDSSADPETILRAYTEARDEPEATLANLRRLEVPKVVRAANSRLRSLKRAHDLVQDAPLRHRFLDSCALADLLEVKKIFVSGPPLTVSLCPPHRVATPPGSRVRTAGAIAGAILK